MSVLPQQAQVTPEDLEVLSTKLHEALLIVNRISGKPFELRDSRRVRANRMALTLAYSLEVAKEHVDETLSLFVK